MRQAKALFVSRESICLGLVLCRLFGTQSQLVAGRPSLAEVVRCEDAASIPLIELGIDSLSWMETLTVLETDLGTQVDNDSLLDTKVTAGVLAHALAASLRPDHGALKHVSENP